MSISSGYQSIHSLVDLKRLSHLLKSLNEQEIKTLEILMDNDALDTINQSIQECDQDKGVPIDQW